MKNILVTMCTLVVFFMGGCSLTYLTAGSTDPMGLMYTLPAFAIAVLNLMVLGNISDWEWRWLPASYIVGVMDLLIALAILFIFGSGGVLFFLLAGVFAIKGIFDIGICHS